MSGFQISMLLGAAAFSLVSMVLVYLVSTFTLMFLLKPKPTILRRVIGFLLAWLATSFYLPFKSVSYYMQHSGAMYIAELIFSTITLFAVSKLLPPSKRGTAEN